MPTVSALLTNFNSGNYHGRLHHLTPDDTPLRTMIGAASPGGGQVAYARTFEWQTTDLRDTDETNVVTDAADAPDAENRRRESVFNVLQTHTDTVGVGFERMAQHQQFNVPGTSAQDAQNIGQGSNPIAGELQWQVDQMWAQIKRDQEASLINGTYNLPTSNAAAARTRGIVQAITSNVVNGAEGAQDTTAVNASDKFQTTAHGYESGDTVYLGGTTAPTGLALDTAYFVLKLDADEFQVAATPGGAALAFTADGADVTVRRGKSLDDFLVEYASQDAWDNGGLREGEGRVLMIPSIAKMQLTNAYRKLGLQPRSVNVFGVNVLQVDNSFGTLSVVLNRHVTKGHALVLSLEQLVPWFRAVTPHDDVPGGITFAYNKARTGNRTETVLYTSIGLEYGNEAAHARIEDLSLTRPVSA